MPLPPPDAVKPVPAIVKPAEQAQALSDPSRVFESRQQRTLNIGLRDSTQGMERDYLSDRAFRGSEEQLAIEASYLVFRSQDGKPSPSPRLDVVARFSPLSKEELFKVASEQLVRDQLQDNIQKLQSERDKVTKADDVRMYSRRIESCRGELAPFIDRKQRFERSIERILKDPSLVRELKTPEERKEVVQHLFEEVKALHDNISDQECAIAVLEHKLSEAREHTMRLAAEKKLALDELDTQMEDARKRSLGIPLKTIGDIIYLDKKAEFLKAWAQLESPDYRLREAHGDNGALSVASVRFSTPFAGSSLSKVFMFDKSGITLFYDKFEPRFVENADMRIIVQEPDFSKFVTPSSQTVPQGDLALTTRAATEDERKQSSLSRDRIEIHSIDGATLRIGGLRYLSAKLYGSPVIDITRPPSAEHDTLLSLELEHGGSAPLVLRYASAPRVEVSSDRLFNKTYMTIRDGSIELSGVHSVPVELHIKVSEDRDVKIPLTRPGTENQAFNSERAIAARIAAALAK
jgi:chaperonin cofactor prefoldin